MILVLGFAVGGVLVSAPPAFAGCSGTDIYGNQGVANRHMPTFGHRADVYVNDFDSHQYKSWRSLAEVMNLNNLVEVGWITWEHYGDQKSPSVQDPD